MPAVQGFLDMLEGVRQGGSSREAQPTVRAVPPVRIHEDEAERRAYWREFCRRDVAPTCVLDFPSAYYGADHGRLNLSGDERLLERLYCFEDHEDDAHQLLGGERRRVILKVHTLLKWGSRGDKLYQRAVKVTAVKVLLARVCSCRCSCGCITVASRVLRACCSACARRQGSTPHKYAGR